MCELLVPVSLRLGKSLSDLNNRNRMERAE